MPAVRQLVNATQEDMDRTASVLTEAYKNDAWSHMLVSGNVSLIFELRRAMITTFYHVGEVWVAEDGDAIMGVAAFISPGHDFTDGGSSGLESGRSGKDDLMGLLVKLPPDLQKWWIEYVTPMMEEHERLSLGVGTSTAVWNLYSLGTHPAHQRRGVAKALTDIIIQKASADGKIITLHVMDVEEESATVALYRKWGFEVKGERILLEGPWGSCYSWSMAKN